MPAAAPTANFVRRLVVAGGLIAAFGTMAALPPGGAAGGIKYPTCGRFTVKDLGKNPGEVFEGDTKNTEFIKGTGKNDLISGGGGPDIIDGKGGDDIICGGEGDDTITGQKGNDTVIGGAGDDKMKGDVGKDRLEGKSGDDQCAGGEEIRSCEDVKSIDIPDFPEA